MNHAYEGFRGRALFWGLAFLALLSNPALAQDRRPYLKSATLYLAADGWVDIWLNGIPIRESQPSTPDSKGSQTIECLPEHLCYFQNENILAIENANAFRSSPPLNRQIGVAYVLRLRFSDGSEKTLSSNDLQGHRAYYLSDRETGEPFHWQQVAFKESGWSTPYASGETIPGVARLSDRETGQAVSFLEASGVGFEVRSTGERHLYRREFRLDISPNPRCSGHEVPAPESSQRIVRSIPRPSLVPALPKISGALLAGRLTPLTGRMEEERNPVIPAHRDFPQGLPTVPLTPTPTVIPKAEKVGVFPTSLPPSFTPSPTEIPKQAPAWIAPPASIPALSWITPTWTPLALPAAIPTIAPAPIFKPAPGLNRLSAPTAVYPRRLRLKKPTPTPVPDFGSSNRAEPFEANAPSVPAMAPAPAFTPVVSPSMASNGGQTIVFDDQPANIYISYADGPGTYRLEVVDASLHPVRVLSEKHVVAQQDDWVEWDGKDGGGQEMPPGQYTVLYTKDGRELKKLILLKTADH